MDLLQVVVRQLDVVRAGVLHQGDPSDRRGRPHGDAAVPVLAHDVCVDVLQRKSEMNVSNASCWKASPESEVSCGLQHVHGRSVEGGQDVSETCCCEIARVWELLRSGGLYSGCGYSQKGPLDL
jgi:hypothetical protein